MHFGSDYIFIAGPSTTQNIESFSNEESAHLNRGFIPEAQIISTTDGAGHFQARDPYVQLHAMHAQTSAPTTGGIILEANRFDAPTLGGPMQSTVPQYGLSHTAYLAYAADRFHDEEVDTNVLAVKFDVLQRPAHMHTGDPIFCKNDACRAVFSKTSVLKPLEENSTKKVPFLLPIL